MRNAMTDMLDLFLLPMIAATAILWIVYTLLTGQI